MPTLSDSLAAVVKSAGIITIGTIVGRIFGLFGEIIIARELEPELYGEVALAYTVVTMSGSLLVFGINEGVTRLASSETDTEDQWAVIQAGLISVFITSIIGIVSIVVLRTTISDLMSQPELDQYLLVFLPYLMLFPLSRIVIAILRSQERASIMILSREAVGRASAIGLLFLFLYLGEQLAAATIYWSTIPAAIVFMGGYFAVQQVDAPLTSPPSRGDFEQIWRFSLPLAISSTIFLVLSRLDILMIGYFLESSEVGNYRAIQPFQQIVTIVMGSFSFLFLPLATSIMKIIEWMN